MAKIQVAKIQDSSLIIFLDITRIVCILAKFTVHIVCIDSRLSLLIYSKKHANL
jgi:acyl-CoA thioesterase FadM